ncbi:MAG TPA: ATP-binding protein [Qipengyuania sp.]|nr:ATP-binding protein [Qipengyuania sp.]
MIFGKTFPWGAAALAAFACVVLAAYEAPLPLAGAVFLLWCGTLVLVSSEPPPPQMERAAVPLDETQMSDLFELSETPVVVTRRDRVTVANAAARDLFGDHILEQDIRMTLRNPEAIRLLDRGDSSGGVTISGLARRRDVWRINRKALPGDIAVLEFINRTAEADMSRAHTDFVANASHELRTPLASIIGYVETLREEGGDADPATAERFLSTIQREAKRLQSLVGDLMSLSRIEAEKHEVPTERLDFSALVERAARDAAGSERAEMLKFDIAPALCVEGDGQQLEQVVRNLVDNALKYGSDDAPVRVSVQPAAPDRVVLTVADRGEGIAPEHLPHLTRRFYRTDPGRSRASGGTGLGLAIVKHVVERHRGRLDIESTVGHGTKVIVHLAQIVTKPGDAM